MQIEWGLERPFSDGLDRGVLYFSDGTVRPWNGLVSVEETVGEGATTDLYFDGVRYAQMQANEDFFATLEAFTYPVELDTLGTKTPVNLSYREGSCIHLVYNAILKRQGVQRKTRSSEVEISAFRWDISCTPEAMDTIKPTSHFVIDEALAFGTAFETFTDTIYGTDISNPFLPPAQEVFDLFITNARLKITDNGDGTWTAEGPDVVWLSADEFQINSDGLSWLDEDTFVVRSW